MFCLSKWVHRSLQAETVPCLGKHVKLLGPVVIRGCLAVLTQMTKNNQSVLLRGIASGCFHCDDHLEDTVEECPAWAEHRRVVVEAIAGGDLSRSALVQVMVRSESTWKAITSFCDAVNLAKEEVERVRERQSMRLQAPGGPGGGRRRRRPGRQ